MTTKFLFVKLSALGKSFVLMLSVVSAAVYADTLSNLSDTQQRILVKSLLIYSRGNIEPKQNALKRLRTLAQKERLQFDEKLTIDQLHQIADTLTLDVRRRGHTFDTIYLPPQKVNNGLVRFAYETAVLVDVNVINKSSVRDEVLSKPFRSLIDKPLYAPSVENKVFALQRQQGVDVFAFYSRGERADKIVLNIKIKKREENILSMRFENYGSEGTGKNRLVGDINFHSVLRQFDQLSVALLATEGEGSSTYGYVDYRWPFASLDTFLNLGFGDSRYDLGDGENTIEMSGDAKSYRINLERILSHAPHSPGHFDIGYFEKNSELTSEFGEALQRDESSEGAMLGLSKHWSNFQQTWRVGGGLSLIWGEYNSSDVESGDSQELKKAEYNLLLTNTFSVRSRFATNIRGFIRGQYSDKAFMPGIESMALGGVYAVRAAEPGMFSADQGYVASLEMHWPRLFANKSSFWLAPYIFWDSAKAKNYNLSGQVSTSELSGYGIGISANWKDFSARLIYAEPDTLRVSDDISSNEVEGDAQVLFQLRWQ